MLTTSPENATPSPTTHEVATPDRRPILFLISALVIALDRLTKIWIVDHIRPGYSIPVIPGVFRLSHVLNTGAAFSMMENWRADYVRIGLVSFSAVAAVLVFVLLWRVGRALSLTSVSLALILGGIGVALSTMGAVAMWNEPPRWYPISLIVFALPCAWLGGKLAARAK